MNSNAKYLATLSLLLIISPGKYLNAMEPKPENRYRKVFFRTDCPICLEALGDDNTVETTCGHLFHQYCIDAVFKKYNNCPLCNHDFSAHQSQIVQERQQKQQVIVHQVQQVMNLNNSININKKNQYPAQHAKLQEVNQQRIQPQQQRVLPQPVLAIPKIVNNPNPDLDQQLLNACGLPPFIKGKWQPLIDNPNTITQLLNAGANIDVMDKNGRTPLMLAISTHRHAAIKVLINAGANVNLASQNGPRTLNLAASQNQIDTVKQLLAVGANVNVACSYGVTPLMCACGSQPEQAKIIQLLIDTGAGATINAICRDGKTALIRAAEQGNLPSVQMLLDAGANPDLTGAQNGLIQPTALYHAVSRRHEEVARLLITRGANVNTGGRDGKTILHMASHQRNASSGGPLFQSWLNLIKMLKEAGAK